MREHFYLLIPVLGLKKFLYKSATDRKRWSLGHISVRGWLKKSKVEFHRLEVPNLDWKWTWKSYKCPWLPYKLCQVKVLQGHSCQVAGHMDSSLQAFPWMYKSISPPHPGSWAVFLSKDAPIPPQLSKFPHQPLPGNNPNHFKSTDASMPKFSCTY